MGVNYFFPCLQSLRSLLHMQTPLLEQGLETPVYDGATVVGGGCRKESRFPLPKALLTVTVTSAWDVLQQRFFTRELCDFRQIV